MALQWLYSFHRIKEDFMVQAETQIPEMPGTRLLC
jgi:hypothetical protein